jgi:DNA-binding transcriptional MerR regulator
VPSPASPTQLLQIGEVAERAGLSLRMVPYYEEMGLIIPEKRTDGGFRLSTDEHVARLGLIKQHNPRDDAARAQLARFAKQASERCEALRQKLEQGEKLAAELRRTSCNPRASAGKH